MSKRFFSFYSSTVIVPRSIPIQQVYPQLPDKVAVDYDKAGAHFSTCPIKMYK